MSSSPPVRARRLLARVVPAHDRSDTLDLVDGLWQLRLRSDGPLRARAWYWSQIVSFPLRLALERLARRRAPDPRHWMSEMFDETRQAVRRLLRSPGFAVATVVTLALGIGANTAIFSLVKGVLLDPLPFANSDRLVSLWHTAPGAGVDEFEQSEATYTFYGSRSRTLDALGGWDYWSGALTGVDVPERIQGARLTDTMLSVLGAEPAIGRAFRVEDTEPGAPAVAILADGLWQRLYGGDTGALGQTLVLDGVATEVVGVMRPGFAFPDETIEYWIPMPWDRAAPNVSNFSMFGLGRLRADAQVDDLNRELPGLLERLPETYSDGLINAASIQQVGMGAYARPYRDDVLGNIGGVLWILVGAVGFVLLISCANVANLFLVRAESRERELAVRAALGAGRRGLLRLFLADSLVVATIGGAAGLAVAAVAVRLLAATDAIEIPRIAGVDLDGGVVLFNAAVALAAGLLFAGYPLLRYRGARLLAGLGDGGRGATGGRQRLWARNSLVVAQVALALVLLIGSGLLVRSFWHLARIDPGFVADNVLTARIFVVDEDKYPRHADFVAFYQQLVDRIRALPGVESAASINSIPMRNSGDRGGIWFEDFPKAEGEVPDVAFYRFAAPGYFQTVGIPLVRGRAFERADVDEQRPVMLISQSLAERLWPGQDPVGKRARRGPTDTDPWLTIVGVVGDIRNGGLTTDPVEMVYLGIDGPRGDSTWYPPAIGLTVRSTGDPLAQLPAIRGAVHELDPDMPMSSIMTLERVVAETIAPISFTMAALAVAAGVALLLGSIGIYGVVSYVVGQRTREIGVRMALGARQQSVRRMVVRQGLWLALAGTALGLAGAVALTRFLGSLLFGVGPFDPAAFVMTTAALLVVVLLATYMPARRAAAVDPAIALRSD